MRHQLTVDVGVVDGKRKQLPSGTRRRKKLGQRLTPSAATSPKAHTCIRPMSRSPKRARTG